MASHPVIPDPSALDRFVDAIARRNLLWARWQDARVAAAGQPGPLLARANEAQDAYEWAERDLVRHRVALRASTGPTCGARTGSIAGSHGFAPVFCHQFVGLRSYVDIRRVTRFFCPAAGHEDAVRGRWPEAAEREAVAV